MLQYVRFMETVVFGQKVGDVEAYLVDLKIVIRNAGWSEFRPALASIVNGILVNQLSDFF